jgi:uncharacterized protein (UPF0264 family)
VRLLVSVADATDARAALDGGADIIDAKDPSRGGLGAVMPTTLWAIHAEVRSRRPTSAALGDAVDEALVAVAAREFAAVDLAFVKLGFAGIASARRAQSLADAAVRGVREGSAATGVILTAYADAHRAGSIAPSALLDIAARAGAAGVLLDTAFKDREGLFLHWAPNAVRAWIESARARGLLAAVAGKLDAAGVTVARDLGADVAGVRSAACEGAREGRVSATRVLDLATLAHGERAVPAVQQGAKPSDLRRGEDGRLHARR